MKHSLKSIFTKRNENKSPADNADLRGMESADISEICGKYFQMKTTLTIFGIGLALQLSAQDSFYNEKTSFVKIAKENSEIIIDEKKNLQELLASSENSDIKIIEQIKEDAFLPLTLASVKNHGEKNYIKWTVENDFKDGIYVIERSDDGVCFVSAGFKNRIAAKLKIAYFFVDENANSSAVYYRILALAQDGSYKYSNTLKIQNELPSQAKN